MLIYYTKESRYAADSETELSELVTEFARMCDRRKLKVNVEKSKVMRCSRECIVCMLDVRLNGEQLEEVECFKYLGACITASGGVEEDV